MSAAPCPACAGYRLKPEALAVKIHALHIGEVSEMSIRAARDWFEVLPEHLSTKQNEIAVRILKEIRERLRFLNDVGLEYLSLSRNSGTLSGGESQRIRLASQIGSGLTGVLYVLDEPSIGLHQRDNARLLDTLRHLRDIGNTVIVVEHDEDAILTADYVVTSARRPAFTVARSLRKGPLPIHVQSEVVDGEISLRRAFRCRARRTAQTEEEKGSHRRRRACQQSEERDRVDPARCLHRRHGRIGRGQVHLPDRDALQGCRPPRHGRARKSGRTRPHRRLRAYRQGDRHRPVADRAHAALQPGDLYRSLHAHSRLVCRVAGSKGARLPAGPLLLNVKGGRCEACQGDGVIKIEMHFLPDVYVTCDVCHGKRYNRETLDVHFKGKSIADVLDMTVEEGVEFFAAVPAVRDKLVTLNQVGLGYIKIGQQANTLSGGEAQRVKLAKELSKRSTGRTLYILDEPTTGLHFHDVAKLLEVLHELVNQGNSVVVIEHNLEVIKTADWTSTSARKAATAVARSLRKGRRRGREGAALLYRPVPEGASGAPAGEEGGCGGVMRGLLKAGGVSDSPRLQRFCVSE